MIPSCVFIATYTLFGITVDSVSLGKTTMFEKKTPSAINVLVRDIFEAIESKDLARLKSLSQAGFDASVEDHYAVVNLANAGVVVLVDDEDVLLKTRNLVTIFEMAKGIAQLIELLKKYELEKDEFVRKIGKAAALFHDAHPVLFRAANNPYWNGWPMLKCPSASNPLCLLLDWLRMEHRVLSKRCVDARKAIKAAKAQISFTNDLKKIHPVELRYPDLAVDENTAMTVTTLN